MTFTSVVHGLLESDARLAPTEAGELHLEETDPSASLKKVIIQLPAQLSSAAFALDFKIQRSKGKSPACLSEVLNASGPHPLRAACDAVICLEDGPHTHVIHIEIKSSKDKRTIGQLRNSKRFTQFLRGLAEEWHGISGTFSDWFVILLGDGREPSRKRRTSISKSSYPSSQQPSRSAQNPAIISVQSGDRLHLGRLYNSIK